MNDYFQSDKYLKYLQNQYSDKNSKEYERYLLINKLIKSKNYKSVLDAGSGPGFLCDILNKKNNLKQIVGIDYSNYYTDFAKKNFQSYRERGGGEA